MASIRNVDKIRATGSTNDALTITSSGYVKPTLIAFEASLSANHTGFDTTSFGTVVPFDQTTYNLSLIHI